jgi:hypothetical protein
LIQGGSAGGTVNSRLATSPNTGGRQERPRPDWALVDVEPGVVEIDGYAFASTVVPPRQNDQLVPARPFRPSADLSGAASDSFMRR